jgi:hypothetical protein
MVRSHREAALFGTEVSTPVQESKISEAQPSARTSARKAAASSVSPATEFPVSELTDEQIHSLMNSLQVELHERAMASDDPEVLGLELLGELNGGDVDKPQIFAGKFVGLGGIIKYNPAATKHTCVLYSINMPGVDPFWAWEDHGTLAYSQSARISEMRHSVAVHVAVSGMQFIRHTMKHDGERHTRLSEDAWDCIWADNGEGQLQIVKSKSKPRNLPVPNH